MARTREKFVEEIQEALVEAESIAQDKASVLVAYMLYSNHPLQQTQHDESIIIHCAWSQKQ